MPHRRATAWARAQPAFVVGACLLLFISSAYGYLAVKWYRTNQEVTRITRIVEGTPGPRGEPGIGVRDVDVRLLPPGSKPIVTLRQGHLTLRLPVGMTGARGRQGSRGDAATASMVTAAVARYCNTHDQCRGPQGPQGPRGARGPRGPRGQAGPHGPPGATMEAIEAFLTTHPFTCTRHGRVWSCTIS